MIIFDSMLAGSLDEEQPEDPMQIWMNKLVKISEPIFRVMETIPQLPDIGGIQINSNQDAQSNARPVVGQDLIDGDAGSPSRSPNEPTPQSISALEVTRRVFSSITLYGSRVTTGFVEGFFGTSRNATRCSSRIVQIDEEIGYLIRTTGVDDALYRTAALIALTSYASFHCYYMGKDAVYRSI